MRPFDDGEKITPSQWLTCHPRLLNALHARQPMEKKSVNETLPRTACC